MHKKASSNNDSIEKLFEIEKQIRELKIFVERHKQSSYYLVHVPHNENTCLNDDVFSVSATSCSDLESSGSLTPTTPNVLSKTCNQKQLDKHSEFFKTTVAHYSQHTDDFNKGKLNYVNTSTPKNHKQSVTVRRRLNKEINAPSKIEDTHRNSAYRLKALEKKRTTKGNSPEYKISCLDLKYQIDKRSTKITLKNVFDSHCHLDRIFKLNRWYIYGLRSWCEPRKPPPCQPLKTLEKQNFLDPCLQSKFEGCITVCCDPERWNDEWYNWLTQEPNVWVTYGCHPANAYFYEDWAECELLKLLDYPKVMALGEIGLDETYYDRKEGPNLKVQEKVFKRQIKIAIIKNKPICIHLRAAQGNGTVWNLAKQILVDSGLPSTWKIHMHCFNHTLENALDWLKEFPNMKFGLIPNYFNEQVAINLDLKHILLETDSPYFVPLSPRRQRNSPKYSVPENVLHIAVQISNIRSIPVDQVLLANRQNVEFIYGIVFSTGRKKRTSISKETSEYVDDSGSTVKKQSNNSNPSQKIEANRQNPACLLN